MKLSDFIPKFLRKKQKKEYRTDMTFDEFVDENGEKDLEKESAEYAARQGLIFLKAIRDGSLNEENYKDYLLEESNNGGEIANCLLWALYKLSFDKGAPTGKGVFKPHFIGDKDNEKKLNLIHRILSESGGHSRISSHYYAKHISPNYDREYKLGIFSYVASRLFRLTPGSGISLNTATSQRTWAGTIYYDLIKEDGVVKLVIKPEKHDLNMEDIEETKAHYRNWGKAIRDPKGRGVGDIPSRRESKGWRRPKDKSVNAGIGPAVAGKTFEDEVIVFTSDKLSKKKPIIFTKEDLPRTVSSKVIPVTQEQSSLQIKRRKSKNSQS